MRPVLRSLVLGAVPLVVVPLGAGCSQQKIADLEVEVAALKAEVETLEGTALPEEQAHRDVAKAELAHLENEVRRLDNERVRVERALVSAWRGSDEERARMVGEAHLPDALKGPLLALQARLGAASPQRALATALGKRDAEALRELLVDWHREAEARAQILQIRQQLGLTLNDDDNEGCEPQGADARCFSVPPVEGWPRRWWCSAEPAEGREEVLIGSDAGFLQVQRLPPGRAATEAVLGWVGARRLAVLSRPPGDDAAPVLRLFQQGDVMREARTVVLKKGSTAVLADLDGKPGDELAFVTAGGEPTVLGQEDPKAEQTCALLAKASAPGLQAVKEACQGPNKR